MLGPDIAGSVTHDGVTSSSNTATTDEIRVSLGIPETPDADDTTEALDTPASPDLTPVVPESTVEPPSPQAKAKFDPSKDPAKRIAKATYEREQAKREAAVEIQRVRDESKRDLDALRAELQALKPHEQPQAKPAADTEPKLEDFADAPDPYAAWMRALAKHDLKQEWATREQQQLEARTKYQQEQTAKQRETAEQTRIAAFGQKLQDAFAADPNLEVLMAGSDVTITRPMADAIIESDAPHKLCAYLIEHAEEADRIAGLDSPLKQFRALARLDAQLDGAAPLGPSALSSKKTQAHAPISPVGGGHAAPASGPPDPKTCSQDEFDAYWNAKEREGHLAGARR